MGLFGPRQPDREVIHFSWRRRMEITTSRLLCLTDRVRLEGEGDNNILLPLVEEVER